jgi:hypothetical protein
LRIPKKRKAAEVAFRRSPACTLPQVLRQLLKDLEQRPYQWHVPCQVNTGPYLSSHRERSSNKIIDLRVHPATTFDLTHRSTMLQNGATDNSRQPICVGNLVTVMVQEKLGATD